MPGIVSSSANQTRRTSDRRNGMRILTFTLLVVVLCAQQSAAQCTWSQSSTTVSTPCLVGIGTTAPDARTTIQGGTGQQLTFKDPNGTTRFIVDAQHGPSDFF